LSTVRLAGKKKQHSSWRPRAIPIFRAQGGDTPGVGGCDWRGDIFDGGPSRRMRCQSVGIQGATGRELATDSYLGLIATALGPERGSAMRGLRTIDESLAIIRKNRTRRVVLMRRCIGLKGELADGAGKASNAAQAEQSFRTRARNFAQAERKGPLETAASPPGLARFWLGKTGPTR